MAATSVEILTHPARKSRLGRFFSVVLNVLSQVMGRR